MGPVGTSNSPVKIPLPATFFSSSDTLDDKLFLEIMVTVEERIFNKIFFSVILVLARYCRRVCMSRYHVPWGCVCFLFPPFLDCVFSVEFINKFVHKAWVVEYYKNWLQKTQQWSIVQSRIFQLERRQLIKSCSRLSNVLCYLLAEEMVQILGLLVQMSGSRLVVGVLFLVVACTYDL